MDVRALEILVGLGVVAAPRHEDLEDLEADGEDAGRAVVEDHVLPDLRIVAAQEQDPGAAGHRRHERARYAEVLAVVVLDDVVADQRAQAVLLLEVGQDEDQDAGGVVVGVIVVDLRIVAVLDLDAGDVAVDFVAPNDGAARLAHVDPGVGGADHLVVFDEGTRPAHGVDGVGAVLGHRARVPAHLDVTEDAPVYPGHDHAVAGRVLDPHALDREVVGGDGEPVISTRLPREVEHDVFPSLPDPLEGHVAHREAELGLEGVGARIEAHDRSRVRVDERLLDGGRVVIRR